MGIFSRKYKSKTDGTYQPSEHTLDSNASIRSGASSLKSPVSGQFSGRMNRTSNSTAATSIPSTPISHAFGSAPFIPDHHHNQHHQQQQQQQQHPAYTIPKMELPKGPDPDLDPAGYLRSLGAVRERCKIVTAKALRNDLKHFDVDMKLFPDVVSFVARIIKRDYDAPFTSIPPHGRHQHFCVGGRDRIAQLMSVWGEEVDSSERCRRLIDLFLVSVLLDAGAGTAWGYKSLENGRVYRRSEGLAVASLEMFKTGIFSGNPHNKYQVDKVGLRKLTVEAMAHGLQSKPGNEVAGLDGRTQLLIRLADALEQKPEFFGQDGRPGNLLDYLLAHPSTQATSLPIVSLPVLWNVLMSGLAPIWPASRTAINGTSLGDAWPCTSMPQPSSSPITPSSPTSVNSSNQQQQNHHHHHQPTFSPFPSSSNSTHSQHRGSGSNGSGSPAPWESILPFHKLTQWLTYSLMQPMQSVMKIHFAGTELLTGLPEYRNGGLFIDLGVLTLKEGDMARGLDNYTRYCQRTATKGVEVSPMFEPSDDVVVEWRGVTVGLLDKLKEDVNRLLASELGAGNELTLAQLLEAGSWKGGREIAEVSRPNTKQPPILIDSDGTVF